MERLRSYRFYSSSLLIIYEGDPESSHEAVLEESSDKFPDSSCPSPTAQNPARQTPTDKLVDVRMVDFAKSTNQDLDSSFVHDGPDHGYIFGLENLIKLLQEIARSHHTNYEGDEGEVRNHHS